MSRHSFLAGVGVGAALMYLLDPAHGAERRRRMGVRLDAAWGDAQLALAQMRERELPVPAAAEAETRVRAGDLPGLDGAYMRRQEQRGGGRGTAERRRALDIQQSFLVAAPRDRVYAFWRNPSSYARFLGHVRGVHDLGEGRWRWHAVGRDGATLEWETTLVELVPGESLAWRSEPSGALDQSGVVRLRSAGVGTRVAFRFCYQPAAGGAEAPDLFGADPRRSLDEDLARLRTLLETGAAAEPQGDVA